MQNPFSFIFIKFKFKVLVGAIVMIIILIISTCSMNIVMEMVVLVHAFQTHEWFLQFCCRLYFKIEIIMRCTSNLDIYS